MPMPACSNKFFWFAGPSVTFAALTYMNSWFGVNSTQAAVFRYPQYDASAGLTSAALGITLIWFRRQTLVYHRGLSAHASARQTPH
nr:MipA/OmpV family protein [Paraburkholderia sp. BL8N3]